MEVREITAEDTQKYKFEYIKVNNRSVIVDLHTEDGPPLYGKVEYFNVFGQTGYPVTKVGCIFSNYKLTEQAQQALMNRVTDVILLMSMSVKEIGDDFNLFEIV